MKSVQNTGYLGTRNCGDMGFLAWEGGGGGVEEVRDVSRNALLTCGSAVF